MTIGIPAEQPPIGDVRPDEPIMRCLPCRPLAMERSLVKRQERRIGRQHLRQPLIVDLDSAKTLRSLGSTSLM